MTCELCDSEAVWSVDFVDPDETLDYCRSCFNTVMELVDPSSVDGKTFA